MSNRKTVLIVYAHYEPQSFNGALKDVAMETLQEEGYDVIVSDLYSMQFKPTTTKDDIIGSFEPKFGHFKYHADTSEAAKRGALSSDILEEITKIETADLVIFQFPMQWFGCPAILKGWFDRVLVLGRTYGYDCFYSKGLFRGKKAMLSITTGGPESMYSHRGINGSMEVILWPIQNGVLNFLGYDVLKPHINHAVAHKTKEDLEKILNDWKVRLRGIFDETGIRFLPLDEFEHNGVGSVNEEAVTKAEDEGWLPVGQR